MSKGAFEVESSSLLVHFETLEDPRAEAKHV